MRGKKILARDRSDRRVIALDDEANRCKAALNVRVRHSSCMSPRRESAG